MMEHMNILVIGGTGLLGCAAAQLFIERGHHVKTITLPPVPPGAVMPPGLHIIFGNVLTMDNDALLAHMQGCDCLVFAAGVDERVEFPPPVYEAYQKYNIAPVERLIPLAKQAGLRKTVVLGSYFTHFVEQYPALCRHPYIKSRVEQQQRALSFADDNMEVAVLQLPYIFGTQPGRKPVWTILVEQLNNMPGATLYPKGGTAMLTVRQTAQVIVGAAEQNHASRAWPIACYNLNWDAFLNIVHTAMGSPTRKIIHVPGWVLGLYGRRVRKQLATRGVEMGIDPTGLGDIMCMHAYIDPKFAQMLGATEDDLAAAIIESIQLSMQALQGGDFVGMTGG